VVFDFVSLDIATLAVNVCPFNTAARRNGYRLGVRHVAAKRHAPRCDLRIMPGSVFFSRDAWGLSDPVHAWAFFGSTGCSVLDGCADFARLDHRPERRRGSVAVD